MHAIKECALDYIFLQCHKLIKCSSPIPFDKPKGMSQHQPMHHQLNACYDSIVDEL
jgi:hypothetical protein